MAVDRETREQVFEELLEEWHLIERRWIHDRGDDDELEAHRRRQEYQLRFRAAADPVADAAREVIAASNGGHPGYGTRLARALVALAAALNGDKR